MGCVPNVCRKDENSKTEYIFHPNNRTDIKYINNNSKNNYIYDLISKEFFSYLNEIRTNPDKFLEESKKYNLFEIFIKLKPCPEINYIETNTEKIRQYIIDSHSKKKNINEQENDIKILLNENINDMSLFQTVCLNDDINENVWLFLGENEDDIDKIFDAKYNCLMIISAPLEQNKKMLLSLIFYKE